MDFCVIKYSNYFILWEKGTIQIKILFKRIEPTHM